MKEIIVLELFSGIGGFTKGFIEAGFTVKKHFFSEIDKHAIANYKYNFPESQYVGSVTNVRYIIRAVEQYRKQSKQPLVITFGSPCQDFSLAGKRSGLDGTKSSLIKYALFLIKWLRPDIYIWENVKGAFSTNDGADYWAIIQAFANIPGYGCEQQLVNTTWVLPQNRERIYFIGHLTGRSKPGIFPFREGFNGLDEGISEARNIRTLTAGGHSGGLHSAMTLIDCNGKTTNTNTSTGYDIATEGDSINFSNPNSKTRRGRIGKGIAQTLDTQSNQGVITNSKSNIRRLTEIEYERLQGFPDNWTQFGIYEKQVWINKKEKTFKIIEHINEVPKSQRYKCCGNAVTATIVKIIAERIELTHG